MAPSLHRTLLLALGCAMSVTAQVSPSSTQISSLSITRTASASMPPPIRMGTLGGAALRQNGQVGPGDQKLYSFTQPTGATTSFAVTLTPSGAIPLESNLNRGGFNNSRFERPFWVLPAVPGTTVRSFNMYTNFPDIFPSAPMVPGETWYVLVINRQPPGGAPIPFNLTISIMAAATPAPALGTSEVLTFGELGAKTVPQMRLATWVYYNLSVPAASIPLGAGFRIELQPLPGTDADLYLSQVWPLGATAFTAFPGAQSTGGIGALDTVTVFNSGLNTSAWLPAGGPYYIQVLAYTECGFTIKAVAVSPTPSPLPYVPTPTASAGALPWLATGTPIQHTLTGLEPEARHCYRYQSDANGEFRATLTMVGGAGAAYGPVNASVYYSWPPLPGALNQAAFYYVRMPLAALNASGLGSSIYVQVARSLAASPPVGTRWVGPSGLYFICAEGSRATSPATYRLLVTSVPPTSASPSPRVVAVTMLQPDVSSAGSTPAGLLSYFSYRSAGEGAVSISVVPTGVGLDSGVQSFTTAASVGTWWVPGASASIAGGQAVLTSGLQQVGYAWASNKRLVWLGPVVTGRETPFSITFDFQVAPSAGAGGGAGGPNAAGEGFCFVIHNDPRATAGGGLAGVRASPGDGLGVGSGGPLDTDVPVPRIAPSLSVCIDTAVAPGSPMFPAAFEPPQPPGGMATYASYGGNMSAARVAAAVSGSAFALPNLAQPVGRIWTMSVRLAQLGATNHAVLHWAIVSATGESLGSWQYVAQDFYSVLNLAASGAPGLGQGLAYVGFAAATSAAGASRHTITNFYWGARELLLTQPTGGDANLYVGSTFPTSVESYPFARVSSTRPGADDVVINTTSPAYLNASGTYFIGIRCAGPAGCSYTLVASTGVALPSATPSPAAQFPSPSRTAAPTMVALVGPAASLGFSHEGRLAAQRNRYFSYKKAPGYRGPISLYIESDVPISSTAATASPSSLPNDGFSAKKVEMYLLGGRPSCSISFFDAPADGAGACSKSYAFVLSNGGRWITLLPDDPLYPDSDSMTIYFVVENRLPEVFGAAATVGFRVRAANDAGPSSAPPPAADSSTTIIAVAVVGAVLGLVIGVGLYLTRGRRGGASVTVITSSQKQEESVKKPWAPLPSAPAAFGGASPMSTKAQSLPPPPPLPPQLAEGSGGVNPLQKASMGSSMRAGFEADGARAAFEPVSTR